MRRWRKKRIHKVCPARELLGSNKGSTPLQLLKGGRLVRKPEMITNVKQNYYTEKVQGLMRQIPGSMRNPLIFLDAAMEKWEGRQNVPESSCIRPTLSKLVEQAMQQQLLKFMEETEQLNGSNHAYRYNLASTTTLTEILDEIYQGTEDKKMTSVMAVDQSSAFDCVSHQHLLQKLGRYNIGRGARDWLDDYLKLRTQYVVIGSKK